MRETITIDGSVCEGGGRIVRTAVALSAVTGRLLMLAWVLLIISS